MELKEVFHVDISPAAAASFSASWSEDDRISIVTEGGVHILDYIPDPSNMALNLTLYRTWLTPKELFPSKHAGIDINSVVWELEQYDVFDALLDVNLTPELPTAKKHPSAVVQAAWSSAGLLPYTRCALATVTNYGTVTLHEGNGVRWQELANVTRQYLDACLQTWESPGGDPQRLYQEMKERSSQLITTSLCWSPLRADYAYLVCGQLDGRVLFWKVRASKRVVCKLQPELMISLQAKSNLHKILSLKWYQLEGNSALLLAGGYNGRISSWLVTEQGDGLTCSEDCVWVDEDRVSVQQFVTLLRPEPVVVAVKGTHLVLMQFDNAGARLKVLVHDVGSLEITGVMAMDDRTLLVVTQASQLYKLQMGDLEADQAFVEEELLVDKNLGHWSLCGLIASRHRMLTAFVCRLCKAYDHLIHREPSQICFLRQPVNLEDLLSVILSNPNKKLTEFWEHLEVIRVQSLADGCVPGLQFATEEQSLEQYSSYELRVAIVLLNMALAQSDSPDTVQLLRRRVEAMAFLLFTRRVCQKMSSLVKSATTEKTELASLGTMRLWLASLLARGEVEGPNTLKLITNTLNLRRLQGELQEEFCHICSAKSPVDCHMEMTCPEGHALPRCSLTMRPCSSMPYLLCRTCGALALCDAERQEEELLCVYCERHFVVNEKIQPNIPSLQLSLKEEVVC